MAYVHDWYAIEDSSKKRDIQIVKQVIQSSQNKLRIDTDKYDPLHLIFLNVVWAMIDEP